MQNPESLEHANSSTGRTKNGYVRSCMCGFHDCNRELIWRYLAIGDPLGIVGEYISIPALPINPRSAGQMKTSLFVQMIYNTLGLPIGLAVKQKTLSILHWHPSQRSAMLRSKSKPLTRGLLDPEIDAHLISWLLSEGHLSVDDELHGGFYFNKPTMTNQCIKEELEEQEIKVWTQTGQLLEKVVLANRTVRVAKPPNGKLTFRGLLEEKINAIQNSDRTEPAECVRVVDIPHYIRAKRKQRFERMTSRGQTISIDLNNVGSTLVPMYANGAGNDYHVRPACGRSPSPLCKFNLAFCLDPTVDNLLVTYNRSLEIGTSRERSFVAREGYDFYLDEVGNPCYWFKSKRQGYWLVNDFLSGDVVEKVVIFAKSHQINDIGIYLSILCGFVSKLPKAKKEWDYHIQEGASRQGGRFDQQLALNELFQSDLIYTAACHIGKCLDLKDGRRFLWETWDPFNCVFDCIYERNMQNYRRMQRNMALEGVPHNKHKEHLQYLSRLHKFMIMLWTQQSTDEMSEEIYNQVCYGFHSVTSFLEPLKDLSYTDVMMTLKRAFSSSSLQSIKADSLLQFCLVSHLIYDDDFPCGYEGLALPQVSWKKLSIALIVSGECVAVPVDIHLRRFFGVFATSGDDESDCIEELRVRTKPSIARYTNDFVAEIGQSFDRGSDTSISFALHVLKEVAAKDRRYPSIIKKWMECYKGKSGYLAILKKGEELGFDQFLN